MFGAAAATARPRWRSIRCLPKVAAWAELPRAQVTTKRGALRCSRAESSASGFARPGPCRRPAPGRSRSSLAMRAAILLMGVSCGGRAGGVACQLQRAFQRVALWLAQVALGAAGEPFFDERRKPAGERQPFHTE